MQQIKTMQKSEKQRFLSMDLIERMIRVEQSVSMAFNKPVPLEQTNYFLSLSPKLKNDFKNYLKRKQQNRICLSCLIIGSLVLFSLFNVSFTGNVIAENIGQEQYNFSNFALIIIFVATVFIALVSFLSNRMSEKKFREKSKIIENILIKKRGLKK